MGRDGPFFGWIVWNDQRKTMVVDHDTQAFVWDDESSASEHVRDDVPGDEPRRIQIMFLD